MNGMLFEINYTFLFCHGSESSEARHYICVNEICLKALLSYKLAKMYRFLYSFDQEPACIIIWIENTGKHNFLFFFKISPLQRATQS